MALTINNQDPLGSLRQAGVSIQEQDTASSSSFQINGIPISTSVSRGTRYTFDVKEGRGLKVLFSKEGLTKKLMKIFSSELQTGDSGFDSVVYIDTDTKEKTAEFLKDDESRLTISTIVGRGGSVAFDDGRVIVEISGESFDDELSNLARLVVQATNL